MDEAGADEAGADRGAAPGVGSPSRRATWTTWSPAAVVALAALLLGVLIAAAWWTSPRMLHVVDSAGYLGAAENIRQGDGLTTPFALATERAGPSRQVAWGQRIPMSEWPPGYSAALAALQVTGLGAEAAARAVSVVGLVVLAAAAYALLRMGTRAVLVAAVGSVLVLVGRTTESYLGPGSPLGWSSVIASERLFLPLAVAALAVACWYPPPRSQAWAVKVGVVLVLVPAAVLVRYLGVAAAVAVAVAFLLAPGTSRRERWWPAAGALAAAAVAGLVPSLLAGGSPKVVAWHPVALLTPIVDTMGAWFLVPEGWPIGVRAALLVVLGLAPVAWVALRWRRTRRLDQPLRVQLVLLAFAATYLGAVVATCLLLDAVVPPEQRILGPLQIALYLLLLVTAHQALSVALAGRATDRAADLVVATLALVLAWAPLAALGDGHDHLTAIGEAQQAQLGAFSLGDLPPGTVVFTDETSTVWSASRLPTYVLPSRVVATSARTNDDFDEQVDETAAILAERDGLAVVFSTGTSARVEDLEARGLVPVATCGGGVVLAAPGSAHTGALLAAGCEGPPSPA